MDVEESVWAPRLGIKGSIDASFRLGLANASQHQPLPQAAHPWGVGGGSNGGGNGQHEVVHQALAPFEFKTGKPHMSHHAQVLLTPCAAVLCGASARVHLTAFGLCAKSIPVRIRMICSVFGC